MEKTVEVLSVFIVQRKISLLFQNFEVKIHLKLFLVSKVIFTIKSVILQNRIKQELQTNGHKAQFIDRMVISQRRDPMNYLQELEMIIYWEKATLRAITTIIPNNFEFHLCLLLQKT